MLKSFFKNSRNICRTSRLLNSDEEVYKYIPKPVENIVKDSSLTHRKIDRETVELLERLSLVGIESEKAVKILEEAIAFADQIFEVDTAKVKPLITVLEDESLYVREDVIESDVTRKELISLTKFSKENYFVTPIGNLEYIPEKKDFELPVKQEASSKD